MIQARPLRLRYTRPALADLNAVLDYIAAHSPQAARRVQVRIQALADLLLQHPHIGRRTSDPTPPDEDDALPLPSFLRNHGNRDYNSRGPARSPRSVRDARLPLTRA